ncbi:Major cold shock protein CspA [compost metagenome]|uniref:Cold shock protein (Beta-ribbon, CspA family) n=1 Tax=Pseudomonas jinjuensis TaxID=198616 RepID=A0A1H0A5F9_9PSED|nr:cold shock protein (beta-ribbon, CspA family) [Pseudomonas jinjuensis]
MLKIVHLLTGAAALLLSFIPALRTEALPYLQQADAVYLALLGMLSLLFATLPSQKAQPLQIAASVLIVLAIAVQVLVLLAPLPMIGDQPAILVPLLIVGVAVALQLAAGLRKAPASSAAPISSDENRETGTVKWFNTSKGFGFISRDSGEDIFVHFRAIRGEGHRILIEGQRVEFSVVQRDKGLQAEDVIAALPVRR